MDISHLLRQKTREKYENENRLYGSGIDDDIDHALTNHEVDNILQGQTKVLTYKQLPQFTDINQLLEPYKNFIILYLWDPSYGHWNCILKHPDRIEFFDPYGGDHNIPDKNLDKVNDHVKKITNQDQPYLTKLLYDANMPIEYNNYKFQKLADDIKTCGRHCIVRVLFKDLLLDDYYQFMTYLCEKNNMNYDELVTHITTNID